MIIERNQNFTDYGYPLDVLWMDVEWARQDDAVIRDYTYFEFNQVNFTSEKIEMMNSAIEASNRRIVLIVDPHISSNNTYSFFEKGLELEQNDDVVKSDTEVYKTNIFVKRPDYHKF
jgi:hypothetical protein